MNSKMKLVCELVVLAACSGILSAQGPCGGKPCGSEKDATPPGLKRQSTAKPKTAPKAPLTIAPAGNAAATTAWLPALSPSVRDAQLSAIDGSSFKLADYSGKVLLVNLWATWCAPCRLEVPELVKLHRRFKSRGVEIVGLSTENPVSEESVRRFMRDYNVRYRIGWVPPDVATTMMQGREVIPQSFVISRDGRIVRRFVGFRASENPALLRQAIEEALNYRPEIYKESPTLPVNSTAATTAGNNLGIELVYVPAGHFVMGSSEGQANEKPVHQVTISKPFYMGKYEVTQKQWKSLMGNNPSEFKGDNLPVEMVSWDDALDFIGRLNSQNDGFTYRLPTEAEWEYAARAGTTGDYAGDIDAMGWYGNNTGRVRLDVAEIYRTDSAPYKRLMNSHSGTKATKQAEVTTGSFQKSSERRPESSRLR